MSETWTVKKILDWTHLYFKDKNVSEPRLGAELMLAEVLNCKRIELYVQFERILTADERSTYREMVKRRSTHEPVQYILGETEFMGLPFRVDKSVLIPRPETELLVDCVIEHNKDKRLSAPAILDIGTGSGCIAVSLAHMLTEASVTALDKSSDAIQTARKNAEANVVTVDFVHADAFHWAAKSQQQFDIIVSNPPYVAEREWDDVMPDVRQFEPKEALLAGQDGLDFYRAFAPLAGKLLKQQGAVFLETGYDQAAGVADMMTNAGFRTSIRQDLNGIDRVVIATRGYAVKEQLEPVLEMIVEKPIDLDLLENEQEIANETDENRE